MINGHKPEQDEFNALQRQIAALQVENERLERHLQLAESRLDWLDNNATYHGGGHGGVWQFRVPLDTELPFRACLDLAMKEQVTP